MLKFKNLKKCNGLSNNMNDITRKLDLEIEISNHMVYTDWLIKMADEVNQLLENYVNDVSLIQNGLINFRNLPPEVLYTELQKLSTKFTLPLPLSKQYFIYNI